MVKNSIKKSKASVISNHKKSQSKLRKNSAENIDNFKEELLVVDKEQEKYDKLFEQKLSEQYKEFRNLKEHSAQSKKFIQIIAAIIVIALMAFLLVSFG